ncbi:MAG: hypothetical protein AAB134_06635 [Pseudomonadota bacterium]
MGGISTLCYALLFRFGDDLSMLASATREGHKLFVLIPIAVALVFSLVHGAFTGHFWDAVGLKPRTAPGA